MSYFDRYTAEHWDHERDLSKHSFPAAEVSSQPDPDIAGLTAHIITGRSEQDVQLEINRLLFPFDAAPGEGHFDRPRYTGARWIACGWTRVARLA